MCKSFLCFVRDLLCIIALVFLVNYGVEYKKTKDISQQQLAAEQATLIAQQTANNLLDSVAEGLESLSTIVKEAKIQDTAQLTALHETSQTTTQTIATITQNMQPALEVALDSVKFLDDLNHLNAQVTHALEYTSKESLLDDNEHAKNKLISRLKEMLSNIEHLQQYYQKNEYLGSDLHGPAGTSSHLIHQRNLQRKLLSLVNSVEEILTALSNEVNGQEAPTLMSASADQGIEHNQELLSTLIS